MIHAPRTLVGLDIRTTRAGPVTRPLLKKTHTHLKPILARNFFNTVRGVKFIWWHEALKYNEIESGGEGLVINENTAWIIDFIESKNCFLCFKESTPLHTHSRKRCYFIRDQAVVQGFFSRKVNSVITNACVKLKKNPFVSTN